MHTWKISAVIIFSCFSYLAQGQYGGGGGYGGGGYGGGRMGGGGMRNNDFGQQSQGTAPKAMEPAEVAHKQTDWMKKNLILTDEQAKHIDSVNVKFVLQQHDDFMELMVQSKTGNMPDREMVTNKLDGLHLAQDNEIKPFLTDLQWELYKKKRKKMFGRS